MRLYCATLSGESLNGAGKLHDRSRYTEHEPGDRPNRLHTSCTIDEPSDRTTQKNRRRKLNAKRSKRRKLTHYVYWWS
jgi:hypothetical protein